MTMTETPTHTPECIELSDRRSFGTTMSSIGESGRTVIYACAHPSHDIPKQIWGPRP